MRDEDAPTSGPPAQMTLTGETEPMQSEPTPEELQAAELSRAAREAVRQPADPRIDRQLARMGLAEDDATLREDSTRVPARVVRAEDLARLEDGLREAQEAAANAQEAAAAAEPRLAGVNRRLQLVTWAVTLEGIAIAILAVLLVMR